MGGDTGHSGDRSGRSQSGKGGPASWRNGGGGGWVSRGPTGGNRQKRRSIWEREKGSVGGYFRKMVLWIGFIFLAAFAAWALWDTRQFTPFVTMTVTSYDSPVIAPNSLAYEDMLRFERLWPRGERGGTGENIGFFGDVMDTDHRRANYDSYLRKQLEDAKGFLKHGVGGPNKDLIVFYVSAHGVVDRSGNSCLLLSDADPYDDGPSEAIDDGQWLPLRELLGRLDKSVPESVGERKPTKKVLFLDSSRFLANPRIGVLYNGFVEGLAEALDQSGAYNFVIINSTEAGQIAWSAPELNGTVFGYFLAAGLSDRATDANADGRVALGELFGYLNDAVSTWVRDNRADSQKPMIVRQTANDDWENWEVAYQGDGMPEEAPAADEFKSTDEPEAESKEQTAATTGPTRVPEDIQDRQKAIEQLWESYDRVPADVSTRDPLGLARTQFWLSRLEELLLAGQAYEKNFQAAVGKAKGLLDTLSVSSDRSGPGELTIPLRPQFVQFLKDRSKHTFYGDWSASPKAEVFKEAPPTDPDSIIAAGGWLWLFEQAKAGTANISQVEELLQVIDMPQGDNTNARQEAEFVEIAFLRMLSGALDREAAGFRIGSAIQTRALAETAAAGSDERCHYWLQGLINAADEDRRLAEDRLFVGSGEALQSAEPLWQGLLDESGEYRRALDRYQELAKAYRTRDEVWAQLPFLWQWVFARTRMTTASGASTVMPEDLTRLVDLARKTHDLAAALDEPFDTVADEPELEEKIQEIKTTYNDVAENYQQLMDDYGDTWDSLTGYDVGINVRTLRDWRILLSLPVVGRDPNTEPEQEQELELGISGKKRNRWRSEYLEHLFADKVDEPTGGEPDGNQQTAASPDETQSRILDLLVRMDMCPVPAMLDIVASDVGDKYVPKIVQESLKDAPEHSDKILFLAKQGGHVRAFLKQVKSGFGDLSEETSEQHKRFVDGKLRSSRDVRKELSQANRLLRITAPWLDPRLSFPDPTRFRLRDLDRHFWMLWQQYRILQDFWGPIHDQSRPYFEVASQHYGTAAGTLYRRAYRYEGEDLRALRAKYRGLANDMTVLAPHSPGLDFGRGDDIAKHYLAVNKTAGLPAGEVTVFLHSDGADEPKDGTGRIGLPVANVGLVQASPEKEPIRRVGMQVGDGMEAKGFSHGVLVEDVKAAKRMTAVSYYRAHIRRTPVPPSPETPAGDSFVATRQPLPTAKISVHGISAKDVAVLFILDCSGSMVHVLSERRSRMDAMKQALKDLLDNLARQGSQPGRSYRIAIRLYGHRISWESKSKSDAHPNGRLTASKYFRQLWREAYDAEIPAKLTPNLLNSEYRDFGIAWPAEDVERIRFSDEDADGFCRLAEDFVSERKELDTVLRSLQPCGVTPLYYAIHESLSKDFEGIPRGAGTLKHLIVLTDGADDPGFRDTGEIPRHVGEIDLQKLLDRLDRRQGRRPMSVTDIKIDAIGIRSNDANLRRIAESTGGKYHSVEKYEDLAARLRAALGACRFLVVPERGSEQQGLIEETIRLEQVEGHWPPSTTKPTQFTVSVQGFDRPFDAHKLWLEGGEDVHLYVDEKRGRLVYQEFSPKDETIESITCNDGRFRVKALTPVRKGNEVTFRVSIQRDDFSMPSRRPLDALAEITPLGSRDSNRSTDTILITDFGIEAGARVPILRFPVRDWPRTKRDAQIKLWFQPRGESIQPDADWEIDTAVREAASYSPQIAGIDRMNIATESSEYGHVEVVVTEVHEDGADDRHLAIVKADPAPDVVKRLYDRSKLIVEHRFHYMDWKPSVVHVRVTARESMKKQCKGKCEPVVVTVPPAD